jgi:hypothetical protein
MMRRGLTLIELLAITIILGMTTAAIAAVTVRSAVAHSDRRFIARLLELDQYARLRARTGVSITLQVDPDERRVALLSDEGAVLRAVSWPDDRHVAFVSDGSTTTVRIDRAGRSVDYEIIIRGTDLRAQVNGLTGVGAVP